MISESKESELKEDNVAKGISEMLTLNSKSIGYAKAMHNNSYSDVRIHLNSDYDEQDTFVEVKLTTAAPLGKYTCQFSSNSGFKFDFNRLKKIEVDDVLFDETKKKITDNIEKILNKDIKNKVVQNLNKIKDQINLLLKEKLESKSGSLFTKQKHIRKGFEFDIESLKISDISFPLFFNKLNDFFEAINKEDQEKYISIRTQIKTFVKDEYVKKFDDIILENLNDNNIEKIEQSLEFIDNPSEDVFSDIEQVQQLLLMIKDIYTKYHQLLSELDLDNDTSKTINQLEPIERTCYTYKYFIEATEKDKVKLEYINDEGVKHKSFSIQAQAYGDETEEYNLLIDSIINYYRNLDRVSYLQIENHIMNLKDGNDSEFDPLKIGKMIGDFKDYYQSLHFNLHVVSEDSKKQNMQMRLYITGRNSNEANYPYSLDITDKNFDKDIYYSMTTNKIEDDEEMNEAIDNILNESLGEGIKTSESASDKFEVQITENIKQFLQSQEAPYNTLQVQHYEGDNRKYYSDIKITNPMNEKNIWIEAKLNKFANLGSSSFKYVDGKWTCTTLDDQNPLLEVLLAALQEHGQAFVQFCKDYLKKDDIKLPKDLTEDLIYAWKNSHSIEDTENGVQFITNKIQIDNFGEKVAQYYQTAKYEPTYYIQSDDNLYLIDKRYNPLNFRTHDNKEMISLDEVYKIGRIQFRAKGLQKVQRYYYSIYCDIKEQATQNDEIVNYECSFKNDYKYPIIAKEESHIKKDDTQELTERIEELCNENDENKVNYVAVKLDDGSKKRLFDAIKRKIDLSQYDNTFCDHMTLVYGDESESFDISKFGQEVELKTEAIYSDEKCCAVTIEKDKAHNIGCQNENPHITIMTNSSTKPVYSNELITKNIEQGIPFEETVKGTITPYYKTITETIDERKKDFRLKYKEQTYRPDINRYAFQNKTDTYGGDDYITTGEIIDRTDIRMYGRGRDNWFHGPDKLDEDNSYVYAKIDDGKDTVLGIKDVIRSKENPRIIYVQTTNGKGMKTVDLGDKLAQLMYFLGRMIRGYLVFMNEEDESCYVCNGIKADGNDVILDFEWGDLTDYTKELKENKTNDNIEFVEKIPYSEIRKAIDTQTIENSRYDRSQFEKFSGLDEINWCALKQNGELLAIAALGMDQPFKGYYYINEIQTLKKGFGKPLIENIIKQYGKVWLMANTAAGETLVDYYRRLGFEEIVIPNSIYECTAYFFCTKECDIQKLEGYLNAYYSNDEEEIDEDLNERINELCNENEDEKEYAWHVSNVPPEKIKKEGFKAGMGNGATGTNLFDDLYDIDYPKNYLFIAKEPWDLNRDEKYKYAYKIDITNMDFYPDFGMLNYFGAYHEEGDDDEGQVFWWEDKDLKSMKNQKLKELIEKQGGQLSTNEMMRGETVDGEYFPDELYNALGSAVIDGDKVNKENRIVDVETRELSEAEKDIGGEKSEIANEISGVKIWLDDIRESPQGFIWFKTVREFIQYVEENGTERMELIDTDHDAGDYQKFGGDYIRCFDYLDFIGAKNITIHIHSANPVGANNIRRIISRNKEENNWREIRNTDEEIDGKSTEIPSYQDMEMGN